MKKLILAAACAALLALGGCPTMPTNADGTPAAAPTAATVLNQAPTPSQTAQIKAACDWDAAIRPGVDVALVLANPQETAVVKAARAIIDPVCANPGGTIQANALSAVSAATAQIVGIAAQIQARKATQ